MNIFDAFLTPEDRLRLALEKMRRQRVKKIADMTSYTIFALIFVAIVRWLFPDVIPFTVFEFVRWDGTLTEILGKYWWILAWAFGITTLGAIISKNEDEKNKYAEELFRQRFWDSLVAGIFEEITFRWAMFLSLIPGLLLTNFIFFGFLGFGVAEWFHMNILGPVANWATLGHLEEVILGSGWAVGAAALAMMAKFRDGHAYLGWIGWINAWFGGAVLLHITLNHGLLPAILIHAMYDVIISLIVYFDRVFERGHLRISRS